MSYTHSCPQFHIIIEGPMQIDFKYCWRCGNRMLREKNNAFQKQKPNEVSLLKRARDSKRICREDYEEADEEASREN